jgi:NAD(P)-dependent dehydrogenase (short-subunit alcohol dehydrogenase family)
MHTDNSHREGRAFPALGLARTARPAIVVTQVILDSTRYSMFRDYPAANLDTHVDSGDSAMISSVAVIAPGAMGSAVAYRLSEHGIHVLTSLRGRGPQTLRRAAAAKMQDADDDAIARADVILSILPPAEALALAERFAAPLSQVRRKAIFVDCNAVNVETVLRISSIIEPTGASFVDGIVTALAACWRFERGVAEGHDENQLFRISVPSRDHSPGDLALSPVHPQLSRRRGFARGARNSNFVRNSSTLGESFRTNHCSGTAEAPSQAACGLAS